jgi:repressor LexA
VSPMKLTKKQADVLRYIAQHILKMGFQPSYREISDHFGWASSVSARHHLMAMEKKGVVVITGESRAVLFKWRLWVRKRRTA